MVMGAQNGLASGKVNSFEPRVTRIARRGAKSTLFRNDWAAGISKKHLWANLPIESASNLPLLPR